MAEIAQRLARLEERLARIEERLGIAAGGAAEPFAAFGSSSATPQATPAKPQHRTEDVVRRDSNRGAGEQAVVSSTITNLLGWAGATALVLAAAYLIRLAIESGWLTPARQVGLAVLGGLILIGAGLALRQRDRRYASLLPAGGVVILFLSIYGAHLYYHLIPPGVAGSAVIVVCLASLWLCRVFNSDLYALFAIIGSYSAPFLLPSLRGTLTDLIIYFTAWSVAFSLYSIWVGKRHIYLVALYLALIGFDLLWRQHAAGAWVAAIGFQTVHLVIFVACAGVFSIKHRSPLTTDTALLHLPALLIFYLLQYLVLDKYAPGLAPWIAAASAVFLLLCYLAAKAVMRKALPGGHFLVSAYAALVLFHAGYLESVPSAWAPWVAFALVPLVAAYGLLRRNLSVVGQPVWFAIGAIFLINYLRIILKLDHHEVPAYEWLVLLYAAEFYAAYYFLRRERGLDGLYFPVILGGHISAMAAAVHLLDGRFAVSLVWGLLALACLGISLWKRDKVLGQSSLLVFAASVGKVLLYDLSSATPVVRIGSLLVLGVTLYLGGWLYQKVNAIAEGEAA